MTPTPNLSLVDALFWTQELHDALSFYRGYTLNPSTAPNDHLRGLGPLIAWVSQEPHARDFARALAHDRKEESDPQHVRELLTTWSNAPEGEIWRRTLATLLRAWAWDALTRGAWAQAQRWFEESFSLFAQHFNEAETRQSDVPAKYLWSTLLMEHVEEAAAHIDHARWVQARLHWGLCVLWSSQVGTEEFEEARQLLIERSFVRSQSYEHESAGRGIQLADSRALEAIHHTLLLLPNAARLHARNISLCTQLGLLAWKLGSAGTLKEFSASLRASLDWFRERPRELPEALRTRASDAWTLLCVYEEDPAVAVDALNMALELDPEHPTAAALLGHASAALSAFALGAGDLQTAQSAYEEASLLLPKSPKLKLLKRALNTP